MSQSDIRIQICGSLTQITSCDWDSCACPEAAEGARPFDPFTTYRFLKALEESGSVGQNTGWYPQYMLAFEGNEIIGVAPFYVKFHSQGEYIFDHNWAHSFEVAGGRYYPKGQIAVPFTPATGRRLLAKVTAEKRAQNALLAGAVAYARKAQLSSVHITFCTQAETEVAQKLGFMPRIGQQFHWEDAGYGNFDGFLASLSSRKRKNLRKERATANDFDGCIDVLVGDDIRPHHLDAFWVFYQDTGARKWGVPYLTRSFFDELYTHLRDDTVLIMARQGREYFAGALNFAGKDTLYGRYWGCTKYHPNLHFELCYYRAIEWALANGLTRVEAGAQGQHKLARGYLPKQIYSLHWVAHPGFAEAIATFLKAESEAVDEEIEILTEYGPFRRCEVEEHQ